MEGTIMRTLVASILAFTAASMMLSAGTAIPGAPAGVKKYSLNNAVGKNGLEFLSKAPMEDINGTSEGVTGMFMLNAANLEATTGKIEVAVLSMKTANSKRDEHMYDAMWLDATKYPSISFDVTGLKDVKVTKDGGKFVVSANAVGTFSCHGVTKASTAAITLTYIPESAETKKRASGNLVMVDAKFNVALADHKVTGKAGVVGKSVGEVIAITAKLFANS
jgi:polyisoprenoid-binding protein YceI